jgi:hypothetical protein
LLGKAEKTWLQEGHAGKRVSRSYLVDASPNPYAPPTTASYDDVAVIRPPFFEAFASGTNLFLSNALLVIAVVVSVWLPINLVMSYLNYYVHEEGDIGAYFRAQSIADGVFGILSDAAVIAIGYRSLKKQEVSYGEAMGTAASLWGRFLIAGIAAGIAQVLGLLCFVIPGVYLMTCLGFLGPVLVVERPKTADAFRRCIELVKGRFWVSLGVMFLTSLAVLIAGVAVDAVNAFVIYALPEEILWIYEALTNLLIDMVTAWTLLVVFALYHRFLTDDQAKAEPALASGEPTTSIYP